MGNKQHLIFGTFMLFLLAGTICGANTEFKPVKGTSSLVIHDIPIDKDGLRTVYVRLYDSEKRNAKYFMDVFMKDPTNLSIFTKESTYDPSKPSVFFIHGFIDNPNWHLSALLTTAFLSRGDVNVFNIGWNKLNKPPYTLATNTSKIVGRKLAEFFQLAIDKNYINISDINMIGHSLGAHLAGHISRYLTKRLPVIVGLDPAGPEFDTVLVTDKLTEKDADVVHYIQTNRYIFGSEANLGRANYWFNGRAILQPGCYAPGCSHFRAVKYYAEAVKNPGTFIAIKCKSYKQFKENKCPGERSIIGFPVDKRAKGLYFITTNSDEPYGKGEDGVKPCSVGKKVTKNN